MLGDDGRPSPLLYMQAACLACYMGSFRPSVRFANLKKWVRALQVVQFPRAPGLEMGKRREGLSFLLLLLLRFQNGQPTKRDSFSSFLLPRGGSIPRSAPFFAAVLPFPLFVLPP